MHTYNEYGHLDQDDLFEIGFNIKYIARKIDGMNYGAHRFLSALVAFRLEQRPNDELGLAIRDLLNKGMF